MGLPTRQNSERCHIMIQQEIIKFILPAMLGIKKGPKRSDDDSLTTSSIPPKFKLSIRRKDEVDWPRIRSRSSGEKNQELAYYDLRFAGFGMGINYLDRMSRMNQSIMAGSSDANKPLSSQDFSRNFGCLYR